MPSSTLLFRRKRPKEKLQRTTIYRINAVCRKAAGLHGHQMTISRGPGEDRPERTTRLSTTVETPQTVVLFEEYRRGNKAPFVSASWKTKIMLDTRLLTTVTKRNERKRNIRLLTITFRGQQLCDGGRETVLEGRTRDKYPKPMCPRHGHMGGRSWGKSPDPAPGPGSER